MYILAKNEGQVVEVEATIRLLTLQVMACPRDFHYHFCVAD